MLDDPLMRKLTMRSLTVVIVFTLAAVLIAQTGKSTALGGKKAPDTKSSTTPAKPPAGPTKVSGDPVTTSTGLKYWDIKKGTGASAVKGKTVKVHYTGWLLDGKEFDSSLDAGEPIEFVLGDGRVIKGWDEGIAGMKVGGKRQLRIPPELGYGSRGAAPSIPPNATLIFDVQLVAVQ
jgi:FKBP-type peptidyl-prolyl cis-trans isomerase